MKIYSLLFTLSICAVNFAFAANPCNPLPCTPDSAAGDTSCHAAATWIVEGKVLDVVDTTKKVCETGYGCATVWENSGVILDDLKVIKGTYPQSLAGRTIVTSGSHCWHYTTVVTKDMIGKRLRFFGTSEYLGYWTRPGFFLHRTLEDSK